jgi:hypothetical protein
MTDEEMDELERRASETSWHADNVRAGVGKMRADLAAARAVLAGMEWIVNHNDPQVMGEWCPCCRGDKPEMGGKTDWTRGQTWGHAPDCALAKALGVTR